MTLNFGVNNLKQNFGHLKLDSSDSEYGLKKLKDAFEAFLGQKTCSRQPTKF